MNNWEMPQKSEQYSLKEKIIKTIYHMSNTSGKSHLNREPKGSSKQKTKNTQTYRKCKHRKIVHFNFMKCY
jgi:hypothetical protein